MSADPHGQRGRMLDATVTRLQMDRPPEHYPPMPAGVQLALLRCQAIPLHFYRYLYDRVGGEWHWNAALTLSDAELSERLWSEHTDIRVLHMNGCPAGFFEVRILSENECRLIHFGLMKHAIGCGLGRWFLGEAIRAAWARNPRMVSVETCTLDHPAALPLYQKMGFSPVWRKEETVAELSPEARTQILLRP